MAQMSYKIIFSIFCVCDANPRRSRAGGARGAGAAQGARAGGAVRWSGVKRGWSEVVRWMERRRDGRPRSPAVAQATTRVETRLAGAARPNGAVSTSAQMWCKEKLGRRSGVGVAGTSKRVDGEGGRCLG
ncbi:hypothetical protein U1Q18_019512 [Sarracenia purpurea var. burkii]